MNQTFKLKPVKTPDGKIYIREVYYTPSGDICDIEMRIKHPYTGDRSLDIKYLKPLYYNVEQFGMYDEKVIKYDPEHDTLAEWEIEDDIVESS